MFKLIALTLLAIGANAHVSQQLLSAPLAYGKYGYSAQISRPSYTNYVASAPLNIGQISGSGYSTYTASAPAYTHGYSSYAAPAVYKNNYLAAPYSSGYIAPASYQSGYIAPASYQSGYIASAPYTTGYSGYAAAAPLTTGYQGGYIASAPLTTGYFAPAQQYSYIKQQPRIIEHNPIHHVQVVRQPNLKEVTVVQKPQQQIVNVLPASVTESQKVLTLPAAAPTGIVPIGHGHKRTIENKVTLEQHKLSPIEEGGNDLAPEQNGNASFQPISSSSYTASAPNFSNFAKEDAQLKQ